jgi:hypothetical protein
VLGNFDVTLHYHRELSGRYVRYRLTTCLLWQSVLVFTVHCGVTSDVTPSAADEGSSSDTLYELPYQVIN